MKNFYLSLIVILLSSSLIKSQDTIILKNAEIIVGKVITIGEKEISYKNFQNLSGPDYSLSLTKVAGIKYPNGYMDVFDESSLSLNFRNYYKSQKSKSNSSSPDNKSAGISQDSLLLNTLLIEHQAIQTKYDQLYQTNRVIIDNQNSQDSLIQQFHFDQELKLSVIQDNIQNQQQASEKKTQTILDSLANLKKILSLDVLKSKDEKIILNPFGFGMSISAIDYYFLLPITFNKNLRIETEVSVMGNNIDYINVSIYPMYQLGKTNIYLGPKFPVKFKGDFFLGLPFGAEYYFDKHMSIGGEIGLKYYFKGEDLYTTSRVLLRFYL